MQAKERKVLDLLRQPVQFAIHRDHGVYGAQPDHRTMNVEDLMRYRREPVAYFGSEANLHDSVEQIPLLLGHHFLTSVCIFMAALAQAIDDEKDFGVITSQKLIKCYLMNDAEDGLLRYKLLPFDAADRESMILLIEKGWLGSEVPSEAMRRDFHSFLGELKQIGKDRLASLYHQLCTMTVFEVCLEDRFGSNRDIENLILLGQKLDDLTNAPRPQVAC